MTQYMQKILDGVKSNQQLISEPLVKMLIESTDKSIALGENLHNVYLQFKNGLFQINEKIDLAELDAVVSQIKLNEDSLDSKIDRIARFANLISRVNIIKESAAYSNPVVKTKTLEFESHLNRGIPDFELCESFVRTFNDFAYDKAIRNQVEEVKSYLNENADTTLVLGLIYHMAGMNSKIYESAIEDLKTMLVNESYSSNILKLKYGNTIPIISELIDQLQINESNRSSNFNLGSGNRDTYVANLIVPSLKINEGVLMYVNDRFVSIQESKSLTGNEVKVHIDENFKIADIDPEYVRNKYNSFYQICESYFHLGFKRSSDGLGVESSNIRNLTLGLKLNEENSLDFYVNGERVGDIAQATLQIHESISLQPTRIKEMVNHLLENSEAIYNIEFIKEVWNDRLLKESMIFDLNGTYYVCEKLNSAEAEWNKKTPSELYEYFKVNYQYDIRPALGEKLTSDEQRIRQISERQEQTLANIEKLELSIKKLDEACMGSTIDKAYLSQLESLKESLTQSVNKLRDEYINLDLMKK